MIGKILVALVILGATVATVVLVAAVISPDRFRVTRTVTIEAPPETVFAILEDLRRYPEWSGSGEDGPPVKRTFSDPTRGAGAYFEWDGETAGTGRLTITEATTPTRIAFLVHFMTPKDSTQTAEIALSPVNGGTKVGLTASGPRSFPSRIVGVAVDLDERAGRRFDRALARLKRVAEAEAIKTPAR